MKLHDAKRVAIIIEAPMQERLTNAMEKAGVTGYSVLPVLAGSGQSGKWSADDRIGKAGGLVQVICIVRPEAIDRLIEYAFPLVERHIGIITVADCQVLRPERF
jgi:PII-like signaling protein